MNAAPAKPHQVEFFPLPSRGGDPYFGLSRAWYYKAERQGLLRLHRLRRPGQLQGKVLVGYAAMKALVLRLSGEPAA